MNPKLSLLNNYSAGSTQAGNSWLYEQGLDARDDSVWHKNKQTDMNRHRFRPPQTEAIEVASWKFPIMGLEIRVKN